MTGWLAAWKSVPYPYAYIAAPPQPIKLASIDGEIGSKATVVFHSIITTEAIDSRGDE